MPGSRTASEPRGREDEPKARSGSEEDRDVWLWGGFCVEEEGRPASFLPLTAWAKGLGPRRKADRRTQGSAPGPYGTTAGPGRREAEGAGCAQCRT